MDPGVNVPDTNTIALISSPQGLLAASIDDTGVLVLTRSVTLESLDIILSESLAEATFIAAFEAKPGEIFAVHVGPNGLPARAIPREDVVAASGEALVEACSEAAALAAERLYESWQRFAVERDAALRAVINAATVGEA